MNSTRIGWRVFWRFGGSLKGGSGEFRCALEAVMDNIPHARPGTSGGSRVAYHGLAIL